jgi:hypothetical protein
LSILGPLTTLVVAPRQNSNPKLQWNTNPKLQWMSIHIDFYSGIGRRTPDSLTYSNVYNFVIFIYLWFFLWLICHKLRLTMCWPFQLIRYQTALFQWLFWHQYYVSYSFHIYAYLLKNYLLLKDFGIYDSHILKSLKDVPFSNMIENRM